MTGFFLDLLMVAILAFCIWQGFRKGLILTVAGVLIIFLSAFLAGKAAAAYAEPVAERLYPIMSWVADDAIDEATRGRGRVDEMSDRREIAEVARKTFEALGISEHETDTLVDRILASLAASDQTVREIISSNVLFVAAYALICLFAFILFMVGLTLLIHFLAAVFKLPVLNLIDKIGGPVVGLFYGLLIMCAVGWAVRYLGIIASPELVEDTTILRYFVNNNMLASNLSLKPESILP
jgi:uncharacterized membrane protein required for colicin V production